MYTEIQVQFQKFLDFQIMWRKSFAVQSQRTTDMLEESL